MSKKQVQQNTTENDNDCYLGDFSNVSDFSSVEDLIVLVISFNETAVQPEEIAKIADQLLSYYGEDVAVLFAGLQAMSNYFNAIREEYHEAIEKWGLQA